jgi:predicted kinase
MQPPVLILVSGSPASGKTTIAEQLAERMNLPLVYKDAIKERLYDVLHCGDQTKPQSFEVASYTVLYYVAECLFKIGQTLIIESNFKPNFETETLRTLIEQNHFLPIQIYCDADREVLLERFGKRAHSDERHAVHDDTNNLDDFKRALDGGEYGIMDIGGEVIHVNTTDFDRVDYDQIVQQIQAATGAKG